MSKQKEITLPKTWNPEDKTFDGISGKTYKILDSLTVGRYIKLPVLELEFAFGATSDSMIQLCNLAYNVIDGKALLSQFAENAINLRRAFANSTTRMDAYLKYCALWTTSEGEDISDLTDDQVKSKVKDWANIDVAFFLLIAQNKIANYIENYKETSLIISRLEKANQI